jgi:DNA polymerase III sliding clamp (beta) subunit (PCNA family)
VVRCELSRDPNDPQRAILKLASNASEIGESEIEVSGVIHRHDSGYPFPFRVALNVAFFLEALTTFPTDEVRLSVHTQQNPAMFLPFGADFEYRTLIMPMSPRN